MNHITSNRFSLAHESAVEHLYEYLKEMDLEQMCEELGITQDDIIDRFKDKVYHHYQHIDRGIEDAMLATDDDADVDLLIDLDEESYTDDYE